ncbi:Protein C9orf138, putative [Gryllus bimaculatus]|nr:Protein C9orf138, putative [Gryllus bimaculatus]
MSYLPWPIMPKEVFPWMKKPVYQPPTKKMNAVSMYSTTFIPPGWFQREPCREARATPQLCAPGCSDKCPPQ